MIGPHICGEVWIGLGSLHVGNEYVAPWVASPYRQILDYELRLRKKTTMTVGDDRLNRMVTEAKVWQTNEARKKRARFYAAQKQLHTKQVGAPLTEEQQMAIALRSLERVTK